MRRTSAAVVAVLSAFALTSCLPLTGTTADVDDFAEAFTIEAALRSVPQSAAAAEMLTISVGDIEGAADAVGLDTSGDPETWRAETVGPLWGARTEDPLPLVVPFPRDSGFESSTQAVAFAEEIGFSPQDVDAFIEVVSGPHRFSVFAGPFDDGTLSGDLEDLGDGVVSAGSGDDYFVDPASWTAARPLGAPLRLAHRDGLIAASSTEDSARAWVDGGPTLADDDELLSVARELDDEGVLGAMLLSAGDGQFAVQSGAGTDGLLPSDMFTTVGIGWGIGDGEGRVVLAYAFDSDAAAEAALAVFVRQWSEGHSMFTGQPLSDLFSFDQAEAEGSVAVVTLVPVGQPMSAMNMLIQADLPFLHR